MIEKKESNSREIRILIVNIIVSLFILFQALNGFGRRDMGFGFTLLLANIFINFSLSFLFKESVFLKCFLIVSFMLHSSVLILVIFSDSSPLINRIIVFIILEIIVSVLFLIFFKILNRKMKNRQNTIQNNL